MMQKSLLTYHFLKIKEGDSVSFEYLFNKMSDKVYGFAFSLLKDKEEAKEVVQETFFRLWFHRNQIKSEYSVQNYLFTIARNQIVSNIRKKKVSTTAESLINRRISENLTEEQVLFNELKSQINSLISQLPAKRKEIFILSRKQGMSNKEIANHLNISIQTVNNQISSAISFFRQHLDKDLIILGITIFFY